MIEISKAAHCSLCSVCHEKASIVIDFRSDLCNGGTSIALCDECRKRLSKMTAKIEHCRDCKYFTGKQAYSNFTRRFEYWDSCSNKKATRKNPCPSSSKCKYFKHKEDEVSE